MAAEQQVKHNGTHPSLQVKKTCSVDFLMIISLFFESMFTGLLFFWRWWVFLTFAFTSPLLQVILVAAMVHLVMHFSVWSVVITVMTWAA